MSSSAATAAIVVFASLVGAAGGAAIQAAVTTRVSVTCPVPRVDDSGWRQFMAAPAPPINGNPRY